jgi:hypothetical protein
VQFPHLGPCRQAQGRDASQLDRGDYCEAGTQRGERAEGQPSHDCGGEERLWFAIQIGPVAFLGVALSLISARWAVASAVLSRVCCPVPADGGHCHRSWALGSVCR